MPNVSSALLREAFIDPIRFALLLDDQFPVYPDMTRGAGGKKLNNELADKLFSLCRSQGWLCDVDDGTEVAERFEEEKHLHQSDLLVLDFHLDPMDDENPSKALRILQRLEASDHFNLVIVYTYAEPTGVVSDIAFSLGAGVASADLPEEVADVLDDLGDALRNVQTELNATVLERFLLDEKFGDAGGGIRTALLDAGVPSGKQQMDAIKMLCARRFEERVGKDVVGKRPSAGKVDTSINSQNGAYWVTRGNVFAVIVNKKEPPDVLPSRLLSAIEDWAPTPLHVMMVHARAALEKAGSAADRSVLDTPRKQAGWMLRVLLGKSRAEREVQLAQLYGRMFEQLIETVQPDVVDFGGRLIGIDGTSESPAARAKELAFAPTETSNTAVYHALNEHINADACRDGPMTTGVIFRGKKGTAFHYWVCLTPACDLIPGQNVGGWDGDLHPLRPITAGRLSLSNNSEVVGNIMKTATYGRHVFLHVDGQAVALEVSNAESRQISIETILLENEGLIVGQKFKGRVIAHDRETGPEFKLIEFEAVALLRPDYANRLLAESGAQRARIGVDFFNFIAS